MAARKSVRRRRRQASERTRRPATGRRPPSPSRLARQNDAERALRESDAFYHSLVESLPQNIFRKDLAGRHTFVNTRYCVTLGLPRDAIIGKTNLDLFPPDLAAKYNADDERVLATGEPFDVVEQHQTPAKTIYVQVIKTAVRDLDGRIIGTQGIFWDVTERRMMEEELHAARDAALDSARLKAEFLANMSHEIRTPLNAVVGMTGLLLDTSLDAEQRDFAHTIRTSADLLLGIINDILDFSKIEAGKMAIEAVAFDLTQVLEETADLLADAAQTKGIELATWIPPHVARMVVGDPGRIRQVLANLLSNAVKFTERGEVVLQVTSTASTGGAAVLRFEVRDSGIGIAPETQARLFTAFSQADGSTTRKYGGTGLGLAICRQLVTLMGGDIGCRSELGKGSTFWFAIPLGLSTDITPRAGAPKASGSLENVRVLVVDDNATNREILRRQVSAWRMRSALVASGPEALAELRASVAANDPFRVVILDMQMPGMDGMGVARAIADDPTLNHTRIVVLTSLAYHPDDADFRRLGISVYLTKPVKQSRLFDCLATLLGDQPGQEVAAPAARAIAASARSTAYKGLRVLLAEDNATNQKVVLRQLLKLGITADAVADGAEVLSAIKRAPYDVILMDCQMPTMDGYEATRRIRATEEVSNSTARQYIVAVTAHALEGDREECLKAGMDDYISKPIRPEELARVLGGARRAV